MKLPKSIKKLYEEVKNYDLIITNDAPLNTALNKYLDKAFLGNFALTSKFIGSKFAQRLFEEESLDTFNIVLKVKKNLNFTLKESLSYTQNILNIWQYTGDLEEVKKFVSEKEIKIIDLIQTFPLYQIAMEKVDLSFLKKNKIAVIGKELFSNLDKKVLPKNYKEIEIFEKTDKQLDKIHIFNSQKEIIDRLVSMITEENQDSIAIVLNIESEYLNLIKAKLINSKIKLNEKLFLFQDFRVREFISILESCFSIHNSKVEEIIPIANIFNIEISETKQDYDFIELTKIDENSKKLLEILQKIKKSNFNYLLELLQNFEFPKEFYKLLDDLNLRNEKVSKKSVNELKYIIENFEIEIDRNKTGVLLIDAKNSTYINRDIIFYVGMDYSWTKILEEKAYFDKDEELEKNIKKFEILISQGEERFFFIPKLTNGEKTIPPFYFNFIFDKKIDSYSKDIFEIIEVNKNKKLEENQIQKKNIEKEKLKFLKRETFSPSALSVYVQCPKKYSYSTLISGIEKDYFIRGELVHAFAEFYVENKEFVKEKGTEIFIEIIRNELKVLSNKNKENIEETKLKFAIESIIEFLDIIEINNNVVIKAENKEESKKSKKENIFSKYFNKNSSSLNAEVEFKDFNLKMNGVIDLLANESLIVDYKTGAKKKVKDIVEKADINCLVNYCDFQPLVYISIFRKFSPNKNLQFKYFFPMMNTYNKLLNLENEENKTIVNYINKSFKEYFISKEFYENFKKNCPKYSIPILELIEDFSYFKDKEITSKMYENPNIFLESYGNEFKNYLILKGLKKKDEKEVSKTLKIILELKKGKQRGQKEVYFFKEDIDEFEIFLVKKLEELNNDYKKEFEFKPVEGKNTCDLCDYKSICIKKGIKEV